MTDRELRRLLWRRFWLPSFLLIPAVVAVPVQWLDAAMPYVVAALAVLVLAAWWLPARRRS